MIRPKVLLRRSLILLLSLVVCALTAEAGLRLLGDRAVVVERLARAGVRVTGAIALQLSGPPRLPLTREL